MGKQRQDQFSSSSGHSAAPLELVHTDIWGSSPISARNRVIYFLTFIYNFFKEAMGLPHEGKVRSLHQNQGLEDQDGE